MPKIGDPSVSPYLTQKLRSIEEVQAERERRQRASGGETKTAAQSQPQPAKPAAADPAPAGDKAAQRPGQRLNEKA